MSTTTFQRRMKLAEQMASAPQPPRRRIRRGWLFALAALLLLWFLPSIMARTPIVQWAIDSAAADLNGRAAVDSVSLGWFSPIRLRGLSLTDAHQQRVLDVPRMESSRTLAGLLAGRSRLGTFRVIEPKLAVAFQGNTSNIEQVLAEYLKPSDKPTGRFDFDLQIVDGTIAVTEVDRARSWNIESLRIALRVPTGAEPLELTASGVVTDPQHAGRFDLALHIPLDAPLTADPAPESLAALASAAPAPREPPVMPDIAMQFNSESFPLALLEPVLDRFSPGTRMSGLLTAEIDAALGGEKAPQCRVKATATVRNLQFATAALGADRINLANLTLDTEARSQGEELAISRCTIRCDLGQIALTGSVGFCEESLRAMPGSLAKQVLELEADVDLPQLAAMLPDLLRLRREMEVTSGQVHLALKSEQGDHGMIWHGQLTSSELKAFDGGREVAWEQPVLLVFAAQETPEGPMAAQLQCQSDFFKLHAVGTTRQFTADATFNLERLAEQLGQFVDLGALGLTGEGWSHFAWKHTTGGLFETEIELHVNRLHVALPGRLPWQERELVVLATASGHTNFGIDTRVEAATLTLAAGAERIEARLIRPVLDVADGGTWPVALQMQGELAQWPPRLALVCDLRDCPVAGRYELAGQITASRRAVHVAETHLRVDKLDGALPGIRILEPQAQLDLTGTWNLESGSVTLAQTTLRTTSLAAATNDLTMAPGAGGSGLELSGTLAYQGNLGGLRQWFVDPAVRPSWHIDGQLTGTSRFEYSGGRTHGTVEAEVENLRVAGAEGQPFRDPRLKLVGRGSYDSATHAIVLDGLEVHSKTVALDGRGGVNMSGDIAVMQFAGQMQYDIQQLSALLRPYVGSGVELTGRHTSPISFTGPLDLQHAQGSGALAWQQGGVYGFPVGPGELKMNLARGVLAADPLAVAVSQGQVQLQPKLHLAPKPMALTLEPGPLATQVQITPAMCSSALKFIAPVLAGVTTAQGAFSIELDRCRVPLDNPAGGDLAGRLIVHSVEVGPGPLIRELAVLLQREAPARLRRESVVPFHMAAGRIHHEDLEMIFPDVTIRTRGSVGLDQTVSLVASLPVPPKWLTNDILRSAFQGQEVRIPVGGTLAAPRLDRAELDKWNRRLLENAAQNVIRDQLDQGLNRLFRPQ